MDKPVTLSTAGILLCPICGEGNLHQSMVEVWDRQEDAATGTHATVCGDVVHIDSKMAGNPSARRQGMTIDFLCEQCGDSPHRLILSIVQHKGLTFIEWL